MPNIKIYKIKLREKYRSMRENMNPEIKAKMDERILKNLSALSAYKKSKVVFTYVSKKIEVDTKNLIKKCFSDNKKVAVPACEKENRKMDFYFINSEDDLIKGTFGLMEPNKEKCEKVTDLSQGLCIVPGFSFDYKGFRLGYGYGYYDRFLNNFSGITMGICYSSCVVPKLPHGRFDKPVDLFVSNKYIKIFKDY